MTTLDSYFDQFVRERTYLNNVTPKTREWYQTAWKAFKRFQVEAAPRSEQAPLISRSDLQQFVVHLRERGVKPVSCNCWLRAMNAFCGWLHTQGVLGDARRDLHECTLRNDAAKLRGATRRLRLRGRLKFVRAWPRREARRLTARDGRSRAFKRNVRPLALQFLPPFRGCQFADSAIRPTGPRAPIPFYLSSTTDIGIAGRWTGWTVGTSSHPGMEPPKQPVGVHW